MSPEDFQRTLLAAIEEGLSMLGESPKQAILFHLEKSFKIKREEISTRPTEFADALEKLFGPGSSYIEKLILKRLYEKLQVELEGSKDLDFLNHIENLKIHLLSGRDP
jgi:hypothetical protein